MVLIPQHPDVNKTVAILRAAADARKLARLLVRPRRAAMHDRALIPHQHVADSPRMRVDIAGPDAEFDQLIKKLLAFGLGITVHFDSVTGEIERFAAVGRIAPD